MILVILGAFGPSVLREFGWLDELDENQKAAANRAGNRAYLTGGVLLLSVVVGGGWDTLSVGSELVSAMAVALAMMVVYYASYCLSFWDARIAVSRVLLVFGLFWLSFVLLSHGAEPGILALESLKLPGVFLLCAWLCRRWPRAVGLLLLLLAVLAVRHYHLIPFGKTDPIAAARSGIVFTLIPLPLVIGGVALLGSKDKA